MPKFSVRLLDTVTYDVEVEADDVESAGFAAVDLWNACENPTAEFNGQGEGVSVLYVEGYYVEEVEPGLYQSVFPRRQAELSRLHTSEADAREYINQQQPGVLK